MTHVARRGLGVVTSTTVRVSVPTCNYKQNGSMNVESKEVC